MTRTKTMKLEERDRDSDWHEKMKKEKINATKDTIPMQMLYVSNCNSSYRNSYQDKMDACLYHFDIKDTSYVCVEDRWCMNKYV